MKVVLIENMLCLFLNVLEDHKVKIKGIQTSSKYINTCKGDSARPPIQVFSAPDSAKLCRTKTSAVTGETKNPLKLL